jgi:cytochrome oxidase Cu insertion factor (SCO1/SenC/PrrC family)
VIHPPVRVTRTRVAVGRALVMLLALATGAAAADSQTPLAVGVMAPETKLIDQNGQSVRLADLVKERDFVVVAFYVKAFTGG